jgi:opacity protein-like surface antigen
MTMTAFESRIVLAALGLVVLVSPVGAQYNPELGLEGEGGGGAEVSVTEGDEDPEDARRANDDDEEPPRGEDEDEDEDEDEKDDGDESHIEAFRLGLALKFFEYESRTTTVDVTGGGSADQDTSNISFGFFPSQLGLNLGFGFAERLVVGARLQLALATGNRTSFAGVETDSSGLSLSLLPYFEVVFNPRDTVAWMAYAVLGMRHVGLEAAGSDIAQTVFVIGAGLGTHIFFTEGASIDPAFEFTFSTGGGSDTGTDFTVHGIVLGLEVGMSLWL